MKARQKQEYWPSGCRQWLKNVCAFKLKSSLITLMLNLRGKSAAYISTLSGGGPSVKNVVFVVDNYNCHVNESNCAECPKDFLP